MKIAIDPGHGYENRFPGVYDPGAFSNNVSEADLALKVALTLKYVFKQNGLDCWLTRNDEHESAPLFSRVKRSLEAGCTHYLSIHFNAGPSGANGCETLYGKKLDIPFADKVHNAALQTFGRRNRGLKPQSEAPAYPLAVMDFPGPVCLTELGFITNPDDRLVFTLEPNARNMRIAFAQALLKGLKKG